MRGPTVLKATDDKTRPLNKHTLMAYSGEAGDTGTFRTTSILLIRNTDITCSPIRGVRPSQHPALQQAQLLRALALRGLLLRAQLARQIPPLQKPIQRQPPPRRLRPHHRQARALLDRLPGFISARALRRSRLRTVLLLVTSRQAPPPRHRLRAGHEDSQDVHG